MRVLKAFSAIFLFLAFSLSGCKGCTQAAAPTPAPFTVLPAAQGEIIEYGGAAGANSLAAAMGNILSQIHQACGEKPNVGQVFSVKGSNSAGVFFTVVDHAQANRQLAGLVIAAQTGTNQFQVGVVSDSADRFAQTANPMMQQLFEAWNPAAASGASNTPGGAPGAASAAAGGGSGVPAMSQVSLSDGTGTISLPAGWNLVPSQSGMGMATVNGPNGELLGLNYGFNAQDTNSPVVQNGLRMGIKFQHTVYYPANADLTKSFEAIFQALRAAAGQGPAPIKVDNVQASSSQGQCVTATGQLNPDGQGMRQMQMLLCRSTPNQNGAYEFILTKCLLPLNATDQQRATADAIMATFKPDMQRAQAIANAQSAPIIAQMQQTYQAHQQALMSFTQQQIANIHQIGAQATARYNAAQASNSAEQSNWEAGENAEDRNAQGFSNYLLDQSVVSNGTGHATMWNTTANALVQSNPNKYEIVDTPNYWKGVDY